MSSTPVKQTPIKLSEIRKEELRSFLENDNDEESYSLTKAPSITFGVEEVENSPVSSIKDLFDTGAPFLKRKIHKGSFIEEDDKENGPPQRPTKIFKSFSSRSPQKNLSTTNRYSSEFEELKKIGSGDFGDVFKCKHKLDGCLYAVKKSKKQITGKLSEKSILREVYSHATISSLHSHPNILRYHSVWKEDNYLYLQSEYCNGGSLESRRLHDEKELIEAMKQILNGLSFIHENGFCHLDIKPANIFVSIEYDKENKEKNYMYKIGDFGLATNVKNPVIEEGDSRYLDFQFLNTKSPDLEKADIFSFGLTFYELASKKPLPIGGDQWTTLRTGAYQKIEGFSDDFNQVIEDVLNIDPTKRPRCCELLQRSLFADKEKQDLSEKIKSLEEEVKKEKTKNDTLTKIITFQTNEPKTSSSQNFNEQKPRQKPSFFRANTTL